MSAWEHSHNAQQAWYEIKTISIFQKCQRIEMNENNRREHKWWRTSFEIQPPRWKWYKTPAHVHNSKPLTCQDNANWQIVWNQVWLRISAQTLSPSVNITNELEVQSTEERRTRLNEDYAAQATPPSSKLFPKLTLTNASVHHLQYKQRRIYLHKSPTHTKGKCHEDPNASNA